MPYRCEIVTPERLVFSGDVDATNLPGIEGQFVVLPNHSALLTVLDFGEVIVRKGGEEEYFAIGGGFAEVQPDKLIVLADSAEQAEEIDAERAEAARQRAAKAMKEGVQEDPDKLAMLEAAIRRANLRLDVSKRRQRPSRRRNIPDLSQNE